jgi:hypothetical protein
LQCGPRQSLGPRKVQFSRQEMLDSVARTGFVVWNQQLGCARFSRPRPFRDAGRWGHAILAEWVTLAEPPLAAAPLPLGGFRLDGGGFGA